MHAYGDPRYSSYYGSSDRRPQSSTKFTGAYYLNIGYGVEGKPSAAVIASVPENKRKLLAGDYSKERSQFLRLAATAGIFTLARAVTHSPIEALGAASGTLGLLERRPLLDSIRWGQQEKTQENLLSSKNALRFYNEPVKLCIPASLLSAEVEFVADELGSKMQVSPGALVDSVQGFPGLSLERGRLKKDIIGTVNCGRFVGFMLDTLHTDGQVNRFLGDSLVQLHDMASASAMRPNGIVSPELRAIDESLQAQILTASLGAYANFLALQRERVANRINEYDVGLNDRELRLGGMDRTLRDSTTPMPWQQVLEYDRAIPGA